MHSLPDTGYLRLSQIIGQKAVTPEQAARNQAAGKRDRRPRPGQPALIPVCASTWWAGVKRGRYPQPLKLGRSTLWRVEDVRALIEQIGEHHE